MLWNDIKPVPKQKALHSKKLGRARGFPSARWRIRIGQKCAGIGKWESSIGGGSLVLTTNNFRRKRVIADKVATRYGRSVPPPVANHLAVR